MAAPAVVCTINSVTRTPLQDGFEISHQLGARSTASFVVRDIRPVLLQDVLITYDAANEFGGVITETSEYGSPSASAFIKTRVTAVGYEYWADTIYVTHDYAAGQTRKQVVADLITDYLASHGITADPSMADGPTLDALSYTRVQLSTVLRDLAALTNATYRIGPTKILYMETAGTTTAGWAITDADSKCLGDVTATSDATRYANRITVVAGDANTPITSTVNDATEQASYGVVQTVYTAPNLTDASAAATMAAALLTARKARPVTVHYDTRTAGLAVGMKQAITLSNRNLGGDYLVQSITLRGENTGFVRWTVEATSLISALDSYLDTFRSWGGGGSSVFNALVQSGSGVGYRVYALGGSQQFGVQHTTWIAVRESTPVMLNGDTLAGRTVVAKVRVRPESAGISVTARVKNVTTGAAAGTGAAQAPGALTWSAYETVALTLAAGDNLYELEVLPSAANEAVYGQGYIEVL